MDDKNSRAGHRERMRKRFLELNIDSEFPDYYLLEMLLFYVVPRKDTREMARQLIKHFGSFSAVFDAEPADIAAVSGLSLNFAVLLKLTLACSKCYTKDKIKKGREIGIANIGDFLMEQYKTFEVEVLSMVCLNASGNFLSFSIISDGQPGSVMVNVRKIVEKAISAGAHSVILAHNHPSGIAIPSEADVKTTKEVRKLLGQIGVYLIDHIILDAQDIVSMAQSSEFADIF